MACFSYRPDFTGNKIICAICFTEKMRSIFFQLANLSSLGYPCKWEWLGPGGLPGLQHQWRVALRAAVGSSPIHSRHYLDDRLLTIYRPLSKKVFNVNPGN